VVALDKSSDSEPRALIEGLLRADIYTKQVIVVDADVDPHDLRQVMAAIALQVQPDDKLYVLRGELGTPLDPSCNSPGGETAKLGIDATRPLQPVRKVTRNRIPRDVLDSIDIKRLLGRT
jgi:2,5-furandicarboxylate decarboxylase 1